MLTTLTAAHFPNMPQDPAITLALITSITSVIVMIVGFWNQQRVAEQNHRWDMEERARNTAKIVDGTERAYNEANHVNKKIETLHKEIGAVLKVAESVKRDTGEHKPIGGNVP